MRVVLFKLSTLQLGSGVDNYYISLAENLAKRGHSVTVVTLDSESFSVYRHLMSVYYCKVSRPVFRESQESIRSRLGDAKWVEVKREDVLAALCEADVVYGRSDILDVRFLSRLGYGRIPPVVYGCHTPFQYRYAPSLQARLHNVIYAGGLYKRWLRGCAGLHSVNSDQYGWTQRCLPFVPVTLVYYPFAIPVVDSSPQEEHSGFHVLFAGRLTEQKGVDILIETIELLSHRDGFEAIHFRVAGSGDPGLESRLQALVTEYSNVSVLGHVAYEEMPQLLQWADVSFIPSRYETVNYVALETGARAKVAVASDIEGPRDVIVNGSTGFLCQLDAGAFAERLLAVREMKRSDPRAFTSMGMRAVDHIADRFDPERVFASMESLLVKAAQR